MALQQVGWVMEAALNPRGIGRRAMLALAVLACAALGLGLSLAELHPGSAGAPSARTASLGPTDPSRMVSFSLVLRFPGHARLNRFLRRLQDPSSPQYRQFIGPRTFGRRYGISAGELRSLAHDLTSRGVQITGIPPQRTALDLRAPARVVDRLFSVKLIDYRDRRGRVYHAPAGEPRVPAAMAALVTGVAGLSNEPLRPHSANDVPVGGMTPVDAAAAYNVQPLHSQGILGQGQSIGIISFDYYSESDVSAYVQHYNLPILQVENVPVNGGAEELGAGVEVNLDLEIAHSVAPGAKIVNYETPPTDGAALIGPSLDALVASNGPRVVSVSWGLCEPYVEANGADIQRDERSIEAADAAGVSVFVASGDSGAYACQQSEASDLRRSVQWPTASPGVISVGGTALRVGQRGDYAGEVAWEGTLSHSGGGGGLSSTYPRPGWQSAEGVENKYSNGKRQVPDISADADPATGWAFVNEGAVQEIGGTSAASPFMAASMALIAEYAEKQGAGQLGFVAPMLYQIASAPQLYSPYHDVTTGTNRYYSATPGWDFATGLGSPDVYNLARDVVDYLQHQ